MRSSPECRLASIGEDDGRFQKAIRGQYCSTLFGRSDHPTKGAKESGGALRSDRLLSHSDGAVLYPQPLYRPWTAPLIDYASMARSCVRSHLATTSCAACDPRPGSRLWSAQVIVG